MRVSVPTLAALLAACLPTAAGQQSVTFGVFAESEEHLANVLLLSESIRTFGGSFSDAPIWVYVPEGALAIDDGTRRAFQAQDAEIRPSDAPAEALWFYFSRKVFAAAQAEAESIGNTTLLVWMDEDTVVLREPSEFLLDEEVSLGYRPVTHKNIGSLLSEQPDEFWSRLYEVLEVSKDAVFPMVTPADRLTIRPYFNAGLLVVRPERGILRKWAEAFPKLYQDPVFREMCETDNTKRIFIHQAALSGAILNLLGRNEMVELPATVNYPLFFHDRYESEKPFDSVAGIATIRYDVYFRDPEPDWKERLTGPESVVAWLKKRLK